MWNKMLMIMRRIILVLMALFTLAAGAQKGVSKKAQRAEAVEKVLASKHFVVDVSMTYPQGSAAVPATSDYSLEVRGDTLVSYLPYFGRAYNIPYGGGKGLNFSAPIGSYHAARDAKGLTRIRIVVGNEEDTYTYNLEVFDNGRATIDVIANEREPISYGGELSF